MEGDKVVLLKEGRPGSCGWRERLSLRLPEEKGGDWAVSSFFRHLCCERRLLSPSFPLSLALVLCVEPDLMLFVCEERRASLTGKEKPREPCFFDWEEQQTLSPKLLLLGQTLCL